MSKKTLLIAVAAAFLSTACVVSPYHGQQYSSRSNTVKFEMWATSPGAQITITCSHHHGNTQTVSTVTGSSNPVTYAGDTLYLKKVNLVLPSGCWESWSNYYISYLKVKQGNNNMAVFDQAGLDCLWEKIGDGESPIASGNTCKRSGTSILIRANS